MLTTVKTYNNDNCTGIWIFDGSTHSIYISFGIAIAIAESLTFDDKSVGPYDLIGYIEIYFEYSGDILLYDGSENVRIEKHEVQTLIDDLWSMV